MDMVLLFSDWRYALIIKNAMSMIEHRVSKAFCAMGSCIIPNVGCLFVCLFVCLFDLILYVPSTIFQLLRDGSSSVEPVLS